MYFFVCFMLNSGIYLLKQLPNNIAKHCYNINTQAKNDRILLLLVGIFFKIVYI